MCLKFSYLKWLFSENYLDIIFCLCNHKIRMWWVLTNVKTKVIRTYAYVRLRVGETLVILKTYRHCPLIMIDTGRRPCIRPATVTPTTVIRTTRYPPAVSSFVLNFKLISPCSHCFPPLASYIRCIFYISTLRMCLVFMG